MHHSKILNQIKLDCFLKFIVHEFNSEMVKSGMMVLTEREKTDVTDTDVTVGWKLQPAAETAVGERERKLTWHVWEWNTARRPLEPGLDQLSFLFDSSSYF
jgi:hypothetical protein